MSTKRPAFAFYRTMPQTRKRKHIAPIGIAYRFALEVGFGEVWANYTARTGIGAKGVALPDGAAPEWADPLEWAIRIELAETRKDSRLFRDDVVGIPRELVISGKAEEAIEWFAEMLCDELGTPVHWVIHDLHSDNPHAHICYAGRRLTKDGLAFEKKRDRNQDRFETTEQHKALWAEVADHYGLALDFSGPQSENHFGHLGPKAWSVEKKALIHEVADAMEEAMEGAGAPFIGDNRVIKEIARLRVEGLSVSEVLALDREPVTDAAKAVKRPREAYRTAKARAAKGNTVTPRGRRPRRNPTPREELKAAAAQRPIVEQQIADARAALAKAIGDAAAEAKEQNGDGKKQPHDEKKQDRKHEKKDDHSPSAPAELPIAARGAPPVKTTRESTRPPMPAAPPGAREPIPDPEKPVPKPVPIRPRIQAYADTGGAPPTREETRAAQTATAELVPRLDHIADEQLSGARAWSEDAIDKDLRDRGTVRSGDAARAAARMAWTRLTDIARRHFGAESPPSAHDWHGITAGRRKKHREDRIEQACTAWHSEDRDDWLRRLRSAVLPLDVAWQRLRAKVRKDQAAAAEPGPATVHTLPTKDRGRGPGGTDE